MLTERIIGVDFGTSTSVIRVKRYKDGEPVEDRLSTKAVTFNMGSTMLPTLIRKFDKNIYYGHEAQTPKKNSELFSNFKIRLESEDAGERETARELTKDFFKYMSDAYKEQSAGGHLGELSDIEKTLISYPVKWLDETKQFMLDTAKQAGFPNVQGMDEAQAAIQAALIQNETVLAENGYLQSGEPVNIMLIDMGAGTTDIVISKYTHGAAPKHEVLCTWPHGGDILFGGREVDDLLSDYIKNVLPEDGADSVLRRCGTDKFKEWKDMTLSPALKRGETVSEFSALDLITDMLDIEAEYSIDRAEFERLAKEYLKRFPLLIKGSLNEAGLRGEDIDLVVLAGGHSQWYFLDAILTDKMDELEKTELLKIIKEPSRLIRIARPQETVALGLVFEKLAADLTYVKDDIVEENVIKEAVVTGQNTEIDDTVIVDTECDVLRVEDVFNIAGRGIVVIGKVLCNSIRAGQPVWWLMDGNIKHSSISEIVLTDQKVLTAEKGAQVSVLLDLKDETMIRAGYMLKTSEKTATHFNLKNNKLYNEYLSYAQVHINDLPPAQRSSASANAVFSLEGVRLLKAFHWFSESEYFHVTWDEFIDAEIKSVSDGINVNSKFNGTVLNDNGNAFTVASGLQETLKRVRRKHRGESTSEDEEFFRQNKINIGYFEYARSEFEGNLWRSFGPVFTIKVPKLIFDSEELAMSWDEFMDASLAYFERSWLDSGVLINDKYSAGYTREKVNKLIEIQNGLKLIRESLKREADHE